MAGDSPAAVPELEQEAGALLSGLTVLDIGQGIAAPFCTHLMAALGAGVIKLEPPCGEPARGLGPFPDDIPDGERSGMFHYLNAGKKGITLDLQSRQGREIFLDLAGRVDAVVENFEPRFLPQIGLGYETLRRRNKRLVLTSISNFGQDGPYRDYKADEIGIHAVSGLMYMAGEQSKSPLKKGGNYAQYMGGVTGFSGTLAALYHREDTGEGNHVDVSLLESFATVHGRAPKVYSYTGEVLRRQGDRGRPFPTGIYPCANGFVVFTGVMDREWWDDFARMVGVPELLDPRFRDRAERAAHADELEAYILPWFVEHTKEEICAMAQDMKLPAGMVATAPDLLESAQLASRGFFHGLDLGEGATVQLPGIPFHFTGAGRPDLGPAPRLGQHNAEVYQTLLDLSAAELRILRQSGVI